MAKLCVAMRRVAAGNTLAIWRGKNEPIEIRRRCGGPAQTAWACDLRNRLGCQSLTQSGRMGRQRCGSYLSSPVDQVLLFDFGLEVAAGLDRRPAGYRSCLSSRMPSFTVCGSHPSTWAMLRSTMAQLSALSRQRGVPFLTGLYTDTRAFISGLYSSERRP